MWPKIKETKIDISDLPETKQPKENILVLNTNDETQWEILTKFSSWEKLRRILALLLRFKHNLKNPSKRITGRLSSSEIQSAVMTICKIVQQSEFAQEFEQIKKHNTCSNRIRNLSPFIDEVGLIRVGGRLKNANIDAQAKHPILLPKSHFVTSLIVDFYHKQYLHAGPQFLQSHILKQFWILSARSLIRSRIHKCITCFRHKPRTVYPKMGDLPEARVNPSPCFSVTGLDYGGPFDVKVHTLRSAKVVKAYLCLFVCFSTKAIHIEIASDLTTDTFIAALTRFISRRGKPSDIHLDNATNFVGASNHLNKTIRNLFRDEITKEKLNEFAIEHSIKFNFIPPGGPSFGGIWESGIKSAKTILKKMIGNTVLTLEEFQTLTVRVEAILNSRPICSISSDPSELDFLTLGHFIIGRPLNALPEINHDNMPLNRLKRWQAVEAITQRLWRKWQTDYLHTLQQKGKWTKDSPNLKVDDLVLLHDNSPPQTWRLGRVISTHPGKDGIVRVVTLKTSSGVLKRPVVKVSPLPSQ